MDNKLFISCGLNGYDDDRLGRLSWAENDARFMASTLRSWGFSGPEPLVGPEMIAARLEASVRQLKGSRPDLFVLFAACHGETIGQQHYLHCKGSKLSDATNAINLWEIEKAIVDEVRPGKLVMILDACRAVSDLEESRPPVFGQTDMPRRVRQARVRQNVLKLFGCRPGGLCGEDSGGVDGHGFFTRSLVAVLEQVPEGRLDEESLAKVRETVGLHSKDQVPVSLPPDPEPIYLKRAEPVDAFERIRERDGAPIHCLAIAPSMMAVIGTGTGFECFDHNGKPKEEDRYSFQRDRYSFASAVAVNEYALACCTNTVDPRATGGRYVLQRLDVMRENTITENESPAPCCGVGLFGEDLVIAMKDGQIRDVRERFPEISVGEQITMVGFVGSRPPGNGRIGVALANPAGERAAVVYDSELRKLTDLGSCGRIVAMTMGRDGSLLAAADAAHQILIWSVAPHSRIAARFRAEKPVTAIALSLDGARVAYALADADRGIFLRKVESGRGAVRIGWGGAVVTALSFAGSDEWLYAADARGELNRWRLGDRNWEGSELNDD